MLHWRERYGALVTNRWLNMSQQVAKKACIRNSVAGRTQELSSCTQLWWGHTLSTEFSFVPPATRKASRSWNVSKREATKLMRSLEHKSYGGGGSSRGIWDVLVWRRGGLWETLSLSAMTWKEVLEGWGVSIYSQVAVVQ